VSKQFDIPFPYLRREHIYVFVDNNPAPYSWINNSRIALENAPPANIIIKLERHTPQTPLHLLQNNRPTAANQFMELTLQAMYYAEEQIVFVAKGDKGDKGDMGDMNKNIYDPLLKQANAFAMANMVEGSNHKILTAAERTKIATALQPPDLLPALVPAKFHTFQYNTPNFGHVIHWPSWVTPDTPVHITAWGGGGSGGYAGGGGGECVMGWYKRSDFSTSIVSLGAGGIAPAFNANDGRGLNGGDTFVGGLVTAKGGRGAGILPNGTNDHNNHGGAGGGLTGGSRWYEVFQTRNSVFGGGCGGDHTPAQGRTYSGGNSVYGGGGGRGLAYDANSAWTEGKSTFGGDGGNRGQNGQVPGGGGGCQIANTSKAGNGGNGRVILKILR